MEAIPIADISPFVSNSDTEAKKAAAKQLVEAVKPHGWAAITEYGLSAESLQDAFATMRKLFDLPISEKMKAPHPDALLPHRGYLAKEIENSGQVGVIYSTSETEKAFLREAKDWKV